MVIAAGLLLGASNYEVEQQNWRKTYAEGLKAPDGWAAVAGLSWLHEGENRAGSGDGNDVVLPAPVPRHAGTVTLKNGHVTVQFPNKTGEVALDKDKFPVAGVTLMAIKRDQRYGIRVWDPNSPGVRSFKDLAWYPVDPKARIVARWVPYPAPKKIPIVSVLGYTELNEAPGFAEFTWAGKSCRLEPVVEEDHLFLMFKDPTSRTETYHSGRFLTVAMPKSGQVILDFNQARNPPCAFTPFATCPIPPRQNWMTDPVRAGEKRYPGH